MFLFLAAAMFVVAAEPDSKPSVGERAAYVEFRTEAQVGYLQKEVNEAVERLKSTKKRRFKTREAKTEAITELEAEIAEFKRKIQSYIDGKSFYFGPLTFPPDLDSFGVVGFVEVMQVLGKDSLLIRANGEVIMVKGVSTEGYTDGREVNLFNYFEVTGTTTYTTALGATNTVFLIEPLDVQPIEKRLRERHADAVKLKAARDLAEKAEQEKMKPKTLSPEEKAEKSATLKLQLAEQFKASDPSKASDYAREAIKLAPKSESAKRAQALLEEL